MSKTPNGSSVSKVPDTTDKQNEAPRNTKRRPHKGGSSSHGESFNEGLQHDRIVQDVLFFLDGLGPIMISPSSPTAHAIIWEAFTVYTTTYTEVTEDVLRRNKQFRDQYALQVALAKVSDSRIADYITAHIKGAAMQLRQSKRMAQAS